MGTQVRQFVDEQIDLLGEETQALWLDPAPILFYVHRSFSLLVTGLNIYFYPIESWFSTNKCNKF